MAKIADLREHLDWISDKISTQIWTLNIGILATTWSILISNSPLTKSLWLPPFVARLIFLLCILSIIFQFAQYFSAYLMCRRILREKEAEGTDEFQYTTTGFLYRAREASFWIKIALTLCAAALLIDVLAF